MKKQKQNNTQSLIKRLSLLFGRPNASLSSARLCGYNGKSFEKTMKRFWKSVEGFSCEWCEGWDSQFMPGTSLSEDERAVTFKTAVKTDSDTEVEHGFLYMIYNTKTNRLSAEGFVEYNDGYPQTYTKEETERALKTVFEEHN